MERRIFCVVMFIILCITPFSSCTVNTEKESTSESASLPSQFVSEVSQEASSSMAVQAPETEQNIDYLTENIKRDENIYIHIETDKNLAEEINLPIRDWEMGKIYPLGDAVIGNHGELLAANMPYNSDEVTTLYLANVETQEMAPLLTAEPGNHFDEVYHDDEMIIFFEYKMWMPSAVALKYYIYKQQDGSIETIDIPSLSINPIAWNLDKTIVRLEDDLYFEVQDSEQIYEESIDGNELIEAGISIYKYNLTDKTFSRVTAGLSPKILDGDLVFIQDKTDTLVKLSGEVVAEKVKDCSIYQDTMIIERYNPSTDDSEVYYYKNGKEEKLFTRDANKSFWHYALNDTYVVWWQTSSSLYLYSLKDRMFYLVSSRSGTRITGMSEKYIFWIYAEYEELDIQNARLTLQYIKFEE